MFALTGPSHIAGLAALSAAGAHGQGIIMDGRLSPAQIILGPNYAIGDNPFHSFGAFNRHCQLIEPACVLLNAVEPLLAVSKPNATREFQERPSRIKPQPGPLMVDLERGRAP